jgi:hypothetical protein
MAGRKSYHDMVLEETGLVSYWNFGAGAGSKAWDQKGTNHGDITGATWTQKANGIWTLDFDGNDYVNMGDNSDFELQNFTISAWVNRDDIGVGSVIVGMQREAPAVAGVTLILTPTGTLSLNVVISDSNEPTQTTITLDAGSWYHVAATKNGTSVVLYINGEQKAIGTLSSATVDYTGTSVRTSIGTQWSGATFVSFYEGFINEVAIYNAALSADTIRKHYQVGVWEGLAA